jgi:peroxiredoxin (alkyl hydroperoxide reductase subunit C)
MAIEVGDDAPDFDLKDPAGESVKLSDFRGKQPVLIVFYPFTFTGVCEGELCTLRDDFSAFTDAGVQVLAISCDSKNAQKVWTEQLGIPYPVLSDFWPHGEVAKAYGVFNEALGCANRATFLVGTDGQVADTFASDNLGQARPAARYEEALAKL